MQQYIGDDQEHGQEMAWDAPETTPVTKPTQQITPEIGKKRKDKGKGPTGGARKKYERTQGTNHVYID
jgi:hypothetical protein